jgi:DNA modification methylase
MDLINIKWTTEKRKVSDLKAYDNNPRQITDVMFEKLKDSINTLGYVELIAINTDNTIVAGHMRVKALIALGRGEEIVEVRVPERKLTKEEFEKYLLVSNKVTGAWDYDKLANCFDNEFLFDAGFEPSELGMDIDDSEEEEDIIEPPVTPKTKLGDVYILGKHKVLCGDSFSPESIKLLLNEEKPDVLFTDPPYMMSMGGGGCFESSTKNMKERTKDIINFDPQLLKFLPSLGIPSYYIFTSKDAIPKYFEIFKGYNFNLLTWCKTNPTPFTHGSFLPDIEYLLFFGEKGRYIWNNSLKPTEIYKKYYLSDKLEGRDDTGDVHPTIKPIKPIKHKLLISSHKNGIVLDLFLGSGTTLIACEDTERRCYGIELEPKYVDVIVQRYVNRTGNETIIKNGESITWNKTVDND